MSIPVRPSFPNRLSIILLLLIAVAIPTSHAAPGTWRLLQQSVGVSAMHMQLLNNDRVIIFDRTNFGNSKINLTASQKCRDNDLMIKPDCTAHSVEYDVLTNTFRPLRILTDTWCSSGAVNKDGQLIQTGGWRDGERGVRIFEPCSSCDCQELGNKLSKPRWYGSNHILPNGDIIIIGGLRQFNYEFYPKTTDATTQNVQNLPFLQQTYDGSASDNNLYPFVFLSPDDNLFIFANNRAILLNYKTNTILQTYPTIPDGQPRCYPSTGSAVLLPLKNIDTNTVEAEVLVCGGAPKGSVQQANKGKFLKALDTCARLKFTDPNPQWIMETMPTSRTMGDMVLLPDGKVMIVNGVELGAAGWGLGRNASLSPVIYNPTANPGSRFENQAPSTIPRVYHSSAVLLRDGRILVGGSNTHFGYEFDPKLLFPTDISLEAFSPSYLASKFRPTITSPRSTHLSVKYKQILSLSFSINGNGKVNGDKVEVTMVLPPFCTHSFSQGQRLLVLTQVGKVLSVPGLMNRVMVRMPNSAVLAPPGYYMVFVVHQGVPSEGKWVKIG